jgi:hypothetical protein
MNKHGVPPGTASPHRQARSRYPPVSFVYNKRRGGVVWTNFLQPQAGNLIETHEHAGDFDDP